MFYSAFTLHDVLSYVNQSGFIEKKPLSNSPTLIALFVTFATLDQDSIFMLIHSYVWLGFFCFFVSLFSELAFEIRFKSELGL